MILDSNINQQLLQSPSLVKFFGKRGNPYSGTIFENYYMLHNKVKGTVGEYFAEEACKLLSYPYRKRENPGHDIIINDIKTEVKISLANSGIEDSFMFNHLAVEKDWKRILLIGLNLTHTYMVWLEKDDFIILTQNGTYVRRQQGGQKSDNDDYVIITKGSWKNFVKEPYIKDFTKTW